MPIFGRSGFYHNDFSQENLYLFQCDAIRKAADNGNCVFVGRTSDYILRDKPNVVNVFITADTDLRIAEIARRHDMTPEEARKYITEGDSKRASYYNYYTGKQWGHGESYDLCLNSSRIDHETAARMIVEFARHAVAACNNNRKDE